MQEFNVYEWFMNVGDTVAYRISDAQSPSCSILNLRWHDAHSDRVHAGTVESCVLVPTLRPKLRIDPLVVKEGCT